MENLTADLIAEVGALLAYRTRKRDAAAKLPTEGVLPELRGLRVSDWTAGRAPGKPADPVALQHRATIRGIGQRLHAAGGMDALDAASHEVGRHHGGKGLSVVNSAWDRIGHWVA